MSHVPHILLLVSLGALPAQAQWRYGGEVSVAEAVNRTWCGAADPSGPAGLADLRARAGGEMQAVWTTGELAQLQVLAFDSSVVGVLAVRILGPNAGETIEVFDPGPWTPRTRGWLPDAGSQRVDLVALLEAHGYAPDTPFSLTVRDRVLDAGNTLRIDSEEPGEFVLGHNDGGLNAGDRDANEPVILGLAPAMARAEALCPPGLNMIVGTDGDDVLAGTRGPDCIVGLGGDDQIRARAGDDFVVGGAGADRILGNAGADTLLGGTCDDLIRGGRGADLIDGGPGNDRVFGGGGNDHVRGGEGDDYVAGNRGNDRVVGGPGADELRGGFGADEISGDEGDDRMFGGRGNDRLDGGEGDDYAAGNRGTDRCIAETIHRSCEVPDDALCDGVDEDQDGAFDEDFVGAATDCGQGACAATGVTACVDGAVVDLCEPAAPQPEVCGDLIDQDCDGAVDEGFDLGAPCSAGVGACAAEGRLACGRSGVFCDAVPGAPSPEVCGDGVDQDCDGATDEGFELGVACSVGTGACAAVGVLVCGGSGAVECDAQPGAPVAEVCGDGIDQDCDGATDEGFDVGAACSAGEGACVAGGRRVCAGETTRCDAQPGAPTFEKCGNGRDDDCDGVTDEGYDVGAACGAGVGLCAAQGRLVCNADLNGVECDAQPGAATAEICGDGVDQDCDGATDEGFDVGAACSAGEGACNAAGQRVCAGETTRCDAQPGAPTAEICGDGVDQDCDGATDEGFDVGAACSAGEGACNAAGQRVCAGETTRCDAQPGAPTAEICGDGVDQDCDGATDEGFDVGAACSAGEGACNAAGQMACAGETTRCDAQPGAPTFEKCGNDRDDDCDGVTDEGYDVGALCVNGVGACKAQGRMVCNADLDGVVCDAEPAEPGVELCGDGFDEDCDGAIDEGYPVGVACVVGQGACERTGQTVCSGVGDAVECDVIAGEPEAELCGDGVDQDCDGATDEGYDVGAECNVGVGECFAKGQLVCNANGDATECNAVAGPVGNEVCGGGDEDCDGMVDEGFDAGEACTVGVGACAADGVTVCDAGSGKLLCDAVPGVPSDELCDGRDNDCDGAADERPIDAGGACSQGVGVCAGEGLEICVGGSLKCDAAGLPPSEEICDALDNDCDGMLDEGACSDPGVCERVPDECEDYRELADGTRNQAFNDGNGGVEECDDQLEAGAWYRFVGEAGDRMAEQAPADYACGTDAPGWLRGGHPTVGDGPVTRDVCFSLLGDDCRAQAEVEVRNCGDFWVYRLDNAPICAARYCGADSCQADADCGEGEICDGGACMALPAHCDDYIELAEGDRNQAFNDGNGGVEVCDDDLDGRWYRFTGEAGERMPEAPPGDYDCGTDSPGWLNGRHPTLAEGLVEREVCFALQGESCNWSTRIDVQSCGDYHVYRLPNVPECASRYCGASACEGDADCGPGARCMDATCRRLPEACDDYLELDQANRNVAFNDGDAGVNRCDVGVEGAWYRLVGEAGQQMPELPPAVFSCGTDAPGWLDGRHPSLEEGLASRKICFAWQGDDCQWSTEIDVANCGDYFVYGLVDVPFCTAGYCGTDGPETCLDDLDCGPGALCSSP